MSTAPAGDLERRKKVRIRIRKDLNIAPQKYEGRTFYVVKDPVSMRYYRFKEQEHFLIRLMDGEQTLDDAQKAYEKRFRPERLTLEDLEQFAQQLLSAGLAQNESPQAGKQLFDRRKKRRRSEVTQALTNILYIKIPVFDPDRLLTKMVPWFGWVFTTWFLVVSHLFILSAVFFVLLHFNTFRDKVPYYHEFFTFKNLAYMWFALGAVKVIHEFGHGLSCKTFGGEVHEMGALFLVFSPCLYANVSDAWTLPSKWKRIIISYAGIYVELIIAALATFVWWNTPSHPFINNMALCLMVVCSVSTVVFNANPLMRYDGYYILADWLEIPNLRDRSNRYLQRLFMDYCLGIEVQPEPYMALWRRVLFVVYAAVSYVYRWVVTFSILIFMSDFLGPKLKVISGMLAVGAAASMIGWPLYRLGKNIHKRGRLPDMKGIRVALTAAAVASILLFVFLVKLPVSRIRDIALVEIHPDEIAPVYVLTGGQNILKELHVRDGQPVREGDLLARFSNMDLEKKLEEARANASSSRGQLQAYQQQLPVMERITAASAQDSSELGNVRAKVTSLENEAVTYEGEVQMLSAEVRRLNLYAERDGLVMNPPRPDEVGRLFDREEQRRFCSIGNPKRLRVLMPLTPDNYALLKEDMRELRAEGKDVDVTLRVHGHGERTWKGKVYKPYEAEAKQLPPQLTTKGGGTIAIKPSTDPNKGFEPQSQTYLVWIDIEDPGDVITPGTMAQVKIGCKWRTSAWWVWRSFSSAFDLGMDLTDLVPFYPKAGPAAEDTRD